MYGIEAVYVIDQKFALIGGMMWMYGKKNVNWL